jgi:hypothetical protein
MSSTSDASLPIASVGGSDETAVSGATVDVASTRLQGPSLVVARVVWLLLLAMLLVALGVGVPPYLASLTHVSAENTVLTPGAADALQRLGIGLDTFRVVAAVVAGAIVLVTLGLALVLVWRRGDDWMVLLVSLFLIAHTYGNISASDDPAPVFGSAFALILYVLQFASFAALFYAGFLLFPNGRFVPRWSWLLLLAFVVWFLVANLTHMEVLGGLLVLGYPLFYGAALVNMVYRYRRAMTLVQRQQTKWVVAGLVASLLANQLFWQPSGLTPLGNTLYLPLSYLGYLVVLLVLPMTFFIAIQRYRLYEIDTILNRALVYGSLTAILALVYVVGVIGSQTVVGSLTHASGEEQSPLLIVITTLVIAALFQPLRRRLQAFIDRRFYRRKYDAARTLAAFGMALRTEVELPHLTDHLLEAVEETMQPTSASLWLRDADRHRNRQNNA